MWRHSGGVDLFIVMPLIQSNERRNIPAVIYLIYIVSSLFGSPHVLLLLSKFECYLCFRSPTT